MFEFRERLETGLLELGEPALVDFLKRYRIEEVEFFAAPPHDRNEIRRLQNIQMLCDALARHIHVLAQLIQRAAIMRMQKIEQLAPARIGQGSEKRIRFVTLHSISQASSYLPDYRQAATCMSSDEWLLDSHVGSG